LKLFPPGCCQGNGKVGELARFSKIGMTEKNLELFFKERVEFEKLLDRRDNADRVGLNHLVLFIGDCIEVVVDVCLEKGGVFNR
jgi:hypothetical protein